MHIRTIRLIELCIVCISQAQTSAPLQAQTRRTEPCWKHEGTPTAAFRSATGRRCHRPAHVRRAAFGVLTAPAAWHDRWRQRRLLEAMDDRAMMDLGLSRADIHREASKPFWTAPDAPDAASVRPAFFRQRLQGQADAASAWSAVRTRRGRYLQRRLPYAGIPAPQPRRQDPGFGAGRRDHLAGSNAILYFLAARNSVLAGRPLAPARRCCNGCSSSSIATSRPSPWYGPGSKYERMPDGAEIQLAEIQGRLCGASGDGRPAGRSTVPGRRPVHHRRHRPVRLYPRRRPKAVSIWRPIPAIGSWIDRIKALPGYVPITQG